MAVLKSDLFTNATVKARADGGVSDTVKSSQSYQQMDVTQRLEDCAVSDPKHIVPGPHTSGPHVAVLHQALETLARAATVPVPPPGVPRSADDKDAELFNDAVKALRGAAISISDRKNANYGSSTANAVLAYKKARGIQRPGMPIDNVVGIMTIQALDRDLIRAAGGNPSPPPPPPGPVTKTLVDIVVRYIGGRIATADDSTTDASKSEATNTMNLKLYLQKTGRRMHAIGRGSDPSNFSNAALVDKVFADIQGILAKPDVQLGSLCIRGSSAGGRHALLLAQKLNSATIPISFLGIQDAAFFANNPKPVNAPIPGVNMTPRFPGFGGIQAARKRNSFQIFQNLARPSLSNAIDWTSGADNKEIHGELEGWGTDNKNVGNLIPAEKQLTFGDLAHAGAVGEAEKLDTATIEGILGAL
jgi:hypothetical protein